MNKEFIEQKEQVFYQVGNEVMNSLKSGEYLTINLSGEKSLFARFNNAKVRQIIEVEQYFIELIFSCNNKSINYKLPFNFSFEKDSSSIRKILDKCRNEFNTLPDDPFIVKPSNNGTSSENYYGDIPDNIVSGILEEVSSLDFVGLYTSGYIIKANVNSKGQKHWFSTENFQADFSIYAPGQQAVKEIYADMNWDKNKFKAKIDDAKNKLEILQKPQKILSPGSYRTYFAPDAVSELVNMLSWNGINMSSLKQGHSALKNLSEGTTLSSLFSLKEDFTLNLVPKFNELGEVFSDIIPIITDGKLENLLTNTRTAKEHKLETNYANSSESMRSAIVKSGNLAKENILKELDTGLYISNLHYLNWSDLTHGRLTGMTRYACFWVENGEIISPINNLRFDETLYNFWGKNLIALTDFRELIPQTGSYEERVIGGTLVPGMLVSEFNYTL
ncbi:MAG: metallopeptidase TldD-related protein [Alphaproteobacteria bacterium]